ncbi:matrixin family metalloprotease [Spirosoma validum]|uniref:Matrixin family metalloprotease n=1 Tax=Spirosoma validum TaxID=2771355 RepID=A0A927B731_9BACT|nr:matrixin family metalloprotease [Spirosoma validum]MBD2756905.1 matrixin family metalloprotease [Spirosoma validum]
MLSTLLRSTLALLLIWALFSQCQDEPPAAVKQVYVSADRNETARRPSTECNFRYTVLNSFDKLNNDSQREAIRTGFTVWQQMCPNLGFLDFQATDRAHLVVRFVDPSEFPMPYMVAPVGLMDGRTGVGGTLRKESNGTYSLLLSNTFNWDKNSLTKAVAYHAGLFLGMPTSTEPGSLMALQFLDQPVVRSKADSVAINSLYKSTCTDLTVSYLPLTLKVSGPISKTIQLYKPGMISIKANGQMKVGDIVGTVGPEGATVFPVLPGYNKVSAMFHAALMYKINNEADWRYWADNQTFKVDNKQVVDLTFDINDDDQKNNTGAFTVVIDYQ